MLPLRVDVFFSGPNAEPVPASASELAREAGFAPGDLLLTKRHWDAFGQTELESALRDRAIDTIVLAGLAVAEDAAPRSTQQRTLLQWRKFFL